MLYFSFIVISSFSTRKNLDLLSRKPRTNLVIARIR